MLYPDELRAHNSWSGQRDSNPRPSAPKADALPDCAIPRKRLPMRHTQIIQQELNNTRVLSDSSNALSSGGA